MLSIETALRLAIIGQQILIAVLFLTGRGNLGVRVSASLFLLSVSAYLLISDPFLSAAASAITPLISLLAIFAPFFFGRSRGPSSRCPGQGDGSWSALSR